MTTTQQTVRKAVDPAAGPATGFLPVTRATPTAMLSALDKGAIQYVLEEAVRAGLHNALTVTGRSKRSLEDHFDQVPALAGRGVFGYAAGLAE